MTMLERLKLLLGLEGTSEKDALLSLLLDFVRTEVLNYCHLLELPAGLEPTVLQITVDAYYTRQGEIGERKQVVGITVGGVRTEYAETVNYNQMTGAGGANFLKDYTTQLNRFRKLRAQ